MQVLTENIPRVVLQVLFEAGKILLESSPYIFFGLLIAGLLRSCIKPQSVVRHLGQGRVLPVIKASLFGIPIPLCSCGVLPMAAYLRRQGANRGAVTAFLIATPESGIDSIAITFALLGPFMAVIRPLAAMCTAVAAGISANFIKLAEENGAVEGKRFCDSNNTCNDNLNHSSSDGNVGQSWLKKAVSGIHFAFAELWDDLAPWFFLGLLLSGLITTLVPGNELHPYFGGGVLSMVLMLLVSLPMYICASASTPIAAALIIKGVSPGTALVFLLAGPASNMSSITVLFSILGRSVTLMYLFFVALCSIFFGLALDYCVEAESFRRSVAVGQGAEIIPPWLEIAAAVLLLILSVKPALRICGRLKSLL